MYQDVTCILFSVRGWPSGLDVGSTGFSLGQGLEVGALLFRPPPSNPKPYNLNPPSHPHAPPPQTKA